MFISWKLYLGLMGKALEVVNQSYDLTNNKKQTSGLKDLLSENISFTGPLMQTFGACKPFNFSYTCSNFGYWFRGH